MLFYRYQQIDPKVYIEGKSPNSLHNPEEQSWRNHSTSFPALLEDRKQKSTVLVKEYNKDQ